MLLHDFSDNHSKKKESIEMIPENIKSNHSNNE